MSGCEAWHFVEGLAHKLSTISKRFCLFVCAAMSDRSMLSVLELRTACGHRGLPISGVKAALILRLDEHDGGVVVGNPIGTLLAAADDLSVSASLGCSAPVANTRSTATIASDDLDGMASRRHLASVANPRAAAAAPAVADDLGATESHGLPVAGSVTQSATDAVGGTASAPPGSSATDPEPRCGPHDS